MSDPKYIIGDIVIVKEEKSHIPEMRQIEAGFQRDGRWFYFVGYEEGVVSEDDIIKKL